MKERETGKGCLRDSKKKRYKKGIRKFTKFVSTSNQFLSFLFNIQIE